MPEYCCPRSHRCPWDACVPQASALATQRAGGRKDSNVHSIYDDQDSSDDEEEKIDRADDQEKEWNGHDAGVENTEFEVVITRKAGYVRPGGMQRVTVCAVSLSVDAEMVWGWYLTTKAMHRSTTSGSRRSSRGRRQA